MKYLLFLAIFALVSTAHASDELAFVCTPAGPNALRVQTLVLRISTENPEAQATFTFPNDRLFRASYAYEGNMRAFKLMPEAQRDGDVSIVLRLEADSKWSATLRRPNLDGFSVLSCNRYL